MLEYSRPRLSTSRGISRSNFEGEKHEYRDGKRARTVHKTVQVNNYNYSYCGLVGFRSNFISARYLCLCLHVWICDYVIVSEKHFFWFSSPICSSLSLSLFPISLSSLSLFSICSVSNFNVSLSASLFENVSDRKQTSLFFLIRHQYCLIISDIFWMFHCFQISNLNLMLWIDYRFGSTTLTTMRNLIWTLKRNLSNQWKTFTDIRSQTNW